LAQEDPQVAGIGRAHRTGSHEALEEGLLDLLPRRRRGVSLGLLLGKLLAQGGELGGLGSAGGGGGWKEEILILSLNSFKDKIWVICNLE
jgi:hypothetical protein